MKHLRNWIPFLGTLALTALFFKMPEASGVFECKTCARSGPYLPMLGAGYFALLIAISMLFPTFPRPLVARGGLVWASLLALTFTYIDLPTWCAICILGHACNIFIWAVWAFTSPTAPVQQTSSLKERLFLTLLAPISVVALFGCLNLTFMIYNLKAKHTVLTTGLQPSEAVPRFTLQSDGKGSFTDADIAATAGVFINFTSPNCPYCTEQLSILGDIATQFAESTYRFINISASLPPGLAQQSPSFEWFEDKEGNLRKLFKVSGYPMLFLVGTDGKIRQAIAGVPNDLKASLLDQSSLKSN